MNPQPTELLQLYVIRHGETAWSLSGQHTGRSEIPLTAMGEDQARALAAPLHAVHFSSVLCSPRLRARRTCALAGLGAQATEDADLAEWDYGEFEGLLTAEIRRSHPSWNLFRDGCPGGESAIQATARADRLLARLALISGNVALFSHAQFSALLGARWIGLPAEAGVHFPLGPAALSLLGHQPAHPEVPVLGLWNGLAGPIRSWPPQAPVSGS